MKGRITKRSIDALRMEAQQRGATVYLRDADPRGFGALCTKTGTCSYFIEYRFGGRQRRVTLGKHGVLTPEQARKLAREELGKVAAKIDVAEAKKDAKEKLSGLTFADVVERFLKVHAKPTRYWDEKRRRLASEDVKAIAKKPMTAITRAHIAGVVSKVQERSASMAQNLFAHLRPLFAWAHDNAIIETNPMMGMRGPAISEARDRVLSDEEVAAFWEAAKTLDWPFENVFKLLLLTAARREEVAGMRWRELDLDQGTWTIAKERCKNGRAHVLDLSADAVRMLDPLSDEAASRASLSRGKSKTESEFVFSTTGRTAISGFSKAKARIDARMMEILGDKFQPWRTHDLRRTAASGMAAMGFQPHIIERVLNHMSGAQGGLVGVYQRHEYKDDRKRVMLAWSDRVASIVNPSSQTMLTNVITLRQVA